MAYFTDFPDILLPSFTDNRNSSTDFVRTKNLFKRAKIRDDIFLFCDAEKYLSISFIRGFGVLGFWGFTII